MYADKFHSKSTPPAFVTADSYASYIGRYGEDKVSIFNSMCKTFGVPDLGPFVRAHGHKVV